MLFFLWYEDNKKHPSCGCGENKKIIILEELSY
jgi:hypothetical protein